MFIKIFPKIKTVRSGEIRYVNINLYVGGRQGQQGSARQRIGANKESRQRFAPVVWTVAASQEHTRIFMTGTNTGTRMTGSFASTIL